MTTMGFIRVSKDDQDLNKQRHLLLEYSQHHKFLIDEFIEIEISSRKTQDQHQITELIDKLQTGHLLLVAELSRLGRNMLEMLNLIHDLTRKGIQIISFGSRNCPPPALTSSCFWRSTAILLKPNVSLFRSAPSRA